MYCISCGKDIKVRQPIRGKYKDGNQYHGEISICSSPKCSEFYKKNLEFVHDNKIKMNRVDGHCRACGEQFNLKFGYVDRNYKHNTCDSEKRNYNAVSWIKPPKRIVPYKPWEDPESLFCDTEFLDKIVGKKVERC